MLLNVKSKSLFKHIKSILRRGNFFDIWISIYCARGDKSIRTSGQRL
jgi:hypothetical protein